jgi:uncharacterized membrane protein
VMSTIACSCTIQQIPTLNSLTLASRQVPKNFLQGVMKERTSVGIGITSFYTTRIHTMRNLPFLTWVFENIYVFIPFSSVFHARNLHTLISIWNWDGIDPNNGKKDSLTLGIQMVLGWSRPKY